MKKIVLIFIFSILLVAFIYANGNDSNDSQGGPTQDGECGDEICNYGENTPSYPYYCPEDCQQCEEDSDCSGNKECEGGVCVLDDDEEDETDDDSDDNNNNPENEIRVCCKVTKSEEQFENRKRGEGGEYQFESETNYKWVEENDCIGEEDEKTKEVVNKSFCLEIKEAIREKNKIKFEARTGQECVEGCICNGRVIKCMLEGGQREMTIYAGSGNVIIQVKDLNMSTNVTLYHHNGKFYGNFSDGEGEVVIFPDQIREKLRERKKIRIEQENISLDEDGLYRVEAKKRSRLFYLFPIREKFKAEIDAENGEILKFRNPWWGFLARDSVNNKI